MDVPRFCDIISALMQQIMSNTQNAILYRQILTQGCVRLLLLKKVTEIMKKRITN